MIELERRAFYLPNAYSEKDTKEKIEDAKKRVAEYLSGITDQRSDQKLLIQVLDNFYLFLENLLEREPHKKGGIQKSQLEGLKIKNEYDVQHLLYAYLKPLYPMARLEVNEDTGYGTVRSDILLDTEHMIEVKCTRKGMEKVIENPMNFKSTYEGRVRDKQINIIIHQPKIL